MKTYHISKNAYFTDLKTKLGKKLSDMTCEYFENRAGYQATLRIGGRYLLEMKAKYDIERRRSAYMGVILPKTFDEAITPYGVLKIIEVPEEIMEIVD
jgi:hypothetical protein